MQILQAHTNHCPSLYQPHGYIILVSSISCNGNEMSGLLKFKSSDGCSPAGKILAMRWILQQKMDRLHLGSKYDWFVLSRSDELHACKHPHIVSLNPAFAWLPEGEHYGGWSDRHIVASSKVFAKVINITNEVVCRSDVYLPKLLTARLKAEVNIELLQKIVWDEVGVSVREFNRTMLLVKTPEDTTSRSGGEGHDLLAQHGLLLKYGGEMTLVKEQCPNMPEELLRLGQKSLERDAVHIRKP